MQHIAYPRNTSGSSASRRPTSRGSTKPTKIKPKQSAISWYRILRAIILDVCGVYGGTRCYGAVRPHRAHVHLYFHGADPWLKQRSIRFCYIDSLNSESPLRRCLPRSCSCSRYNLIIRMCIEQSRPSTASKISQVTFNFGENCNTVHLIQSSASSRRHADLRHDSVNSATLLRAAAYSRTPRSF